MNIDNLYKAKESLRAFVNYNKCDKHCKLPHCSCCCYEPCMSKNQKDRGQMYSTDYIIEGIEYVLRYFEQIGAEMYK